LLLFFVRMHKTFILVLVAVCVAVHAGGNATGYCGEGIMWNLDYDSGVFVVKGYGYMKQPCSVTQYQKNFIRIVVVEKGVRSIAANAFYYTPSLELLSLSDTVEEIGEAAFYVNSLKTLEIPDSVISIGNSSFWGSRNLELLIIGNSVREIGPWAFAGSNLESLILGNSVETIGNFTFSGNRLRTLTIPNSVRIIGQGAFKGSCSLESLIIGESVQYIYDYAFADTENSGCIKLNSLTIPNSVETIGDYAFFGCHTLKSLTIGNSMYLIGEGAFAYSHLESLNLGESVAYIGKEAFKHNYLKTLVIPDSVSAIYDGAFSDSPELESLIFGEGSHLGYIWDHAFVGNKLKSLIFPPHASIGEYAFARSQQLESVVFLESPSHIYREIAESAFSMCGRLQSVSLGNNLLSIRSEAFRGCPISSIIIPESVAFIFDHAFLDCAELKTVAFLGYQDPRQGNGQFFGCTSLSDICVPYNYSSNSFCGMTNLEPLSRCGINKKH